MKQFILNYIKLFQIIAEYNKKHLYLYICVVLNTLMMTLLEVALLQMILDFSLNKVSVRLFLIILSVFVFVRIVERALLVQVEKYNYQLSLHLKQKAYALQSQIDFPYLLQEDVQNKVEMTKRLFDDGLFAIVMTNFVNQVKQIMRMVAYVGIIIFIIPLILFVFLALLCVQFFIYRKNIENQMMKFRKEREIFRKEHYFEYVVQEIKYAQDIRANQMGDMMYNEGRKANDEMLQMTMEYFVYNQMKMNVAIYIVEFIQFVSVTLVSFFLLNQGHFPLSLFIISLKTNIDIIFTLREFVKGIFENLLYSQILSDYFASIDQFQGLMSQNKKELDEEIKAIHLKNVSVTVGDKHILKALNYTFEKGKRYALVGRNGSGKTTLLHTLIGFQKYEGTILFNKNDIREFQILKRVSLLFQQFHYYNTTLQKNIVSVFPLRNEKYKHVLKQFKLMNLDAHLNDASIGQKQRIAIARTLYKDADVFILDELNSALDPIVTREIFQNVFNEAENKILLVVAHKLKSIQTCDEILFLEDGKLVASGSHDVLFATCSPYKTLYESQM